MNKPLAVSMALLLCSGVANVAHSTAPLNGIARLREWVSAT
jgi:hypothetical protein